MNKKYKIYLIVIIILIVIITISLILYINKVQKLTNKSTLNSLKELTKQDVAKIQNNINEHIRILETIVNETENNKLEKPEQVFEIYNRNSGNSQFSRIAIMYETGQTSTNDGQVVDLSEEKEDFFSNNDVKISQTRQSKIDNKKINIYSKKTKLGNENVVILLVIETNKYEEIFIQSIYSGNGNEYIITKEGQIIAKSNKNENEINIYENITNTIDNKKTSKNTLENIKQNIQNNEDGQDILYNGIKKYFVTYQKLNINDWYLIIITKGSAVAEELNQVIIIMFIISILIISIISVVSIYILKSEEKKEKSLYNLAYIDPITKLGNHNYFNQQGEKILINNKIKNKYVIALDIDKFKSFNKKHGHKLGDKLLEEVGKKLKEILKEKSIICRVSNDIYGVIVYEIEDIEQQVSSICQNISKIIINNVEYNILIYLGIYKIIDNKYNLLESFDKALIAHDKVKGNSEKQYYIYNEKIELQLEKENEIENIMQQALEKEEFVIYYQPKISSKSNKMTQAEALVRWIRDGKMIPPNEFIPIFEKNRFIIKLDKYIFEKVCKDLQFWKQKYEKTNRDSNKNDNGNNNNSINNINEDIKVPMISINISKEHFYEEEFIKEFVNIAKKYNIEPKEIELEITESATLNKQIDVIKVMNNIKKYGFRLSLDDFGTGTSTLAMLQNMPIDTLKIDKIFVDKIDFNDTNKNIIEYIVYIAKKLNLTTVAEGVENINQINYLKNIGCDMFQGYYFSKPIDKKNFEKYIENSK